MSFRTLEELKIKFPMIKEHDLITLVEYRDNGQPTGGFLRAFLSNDLMRSLSNADCDNIKILNDYGFFVFNEIPASCHGSYEIYDKWVKEGGFNGQEKI